MKFTHTVAFILIMVVFFGNALFAQEMMESSTQEMMESSTQEMMESSTQEMLESSTQEMMESSTQEMLESSTQDSMETMSMNSEQRMSMNSEQRDSSIAVSFGSYEEMYPINFKIENVPTLTEKWTLIISEYTGRALFETLGDAWKPEGYSWTPAKDVVLYPSIYYVVTISFLDSDENVLETLASRFYIPTVIKSNKAPIIFFEADTISPFYNLYENNSIDKLINFVVTQANGPYSQYRVLIRGHASFITETVEERKKEQIALLDLSQRRASEILRILVESGVDPTRMFYEAFGGNDQISNEIDQRWKNRRVEIIFLNNIDNVTHLKIEDDQETSQELMQEREATVPQQQKKTPKLIEPPEPTVVLSIDNNVDPWPDIPILGRGELSAEHMLAFLLYYTPTNDQKYIDYLRRIILYYMRESQRENVNHDVAFVQMLLETNYLRFTGQVRKEQYNFAGIGVTNSSSSGNWFSTELIGVRAHIQHLKGYATTHPLQGSIVDPRYPLLDRLGLLGSAPLVSTLTGRWASDPNYSTKMLILLRKIYNYSNALTEAGR